MRIGINAFPLRLTSGGARYVFADLLRQLLLLDRGNEYLIFSHPAGFSIINEVLDRCRAEASEALPAGRVKVIRTLDEEGIYPHRDEFDLYFAPLNSLRPRLLDRPTVAILLDIQEQYFPEYFSFAELTGRRELYPEICRAATTVVTISEFCKRCMIEKFGIDGGKIEVMHIAPQEWLVARERGDEGAWAGDALPKPYLFYPANFYRHKNHALLLEAMEGEAFNVVFTGMEVPGGYPLAREIARRDLGERCRCFSNLGPDPMRYLYRHATAVVMPTMFEGFGMPAVEALACGCPLVCSDIPALREVAGENAVYFKPGDVEGLRRECRRIYSEAELRGRLIESGYAIGEKYSWEAAGRRMLEIFTEAAERFKKMPAMLPRIGIVVRKDRGGDRLVKTIQSIRESGYDNLVIDTPGDGGTMDFQVLEAFCGREKLDLVGEVLEGNWVLPGAIGSVAGAFVAGNLHLGEVATWSRGKYSGIARLRLTGDDLWKMEGAVYPEMVFVAPEMLGRFREVGAIDELWRWKMICQARMAGQLTLLRRTLADCDRVKLGALARRRAKRAGMFDFHRRSDGGAVKVPLLRRFEERAKFLSQFLPIGVQNAGTRLWYRLARSGGH